MGAADLVVDVRPSVAEHVAAAQVRVEAVKEVDPVLQLAQRHVPQRWPDRATDVAVGRLAGAKLQLGDLEPAVQQDGQRRGAVRRLVGLDERHEPLEDPLRDVPRRTGLGQLRVLAGDRVLAAANDDPEGAARQRLDRPSPPR